VRAAVELYRIENWRPCDQTGLNTGVRVLAKRFPSVRVYCIDATQKAGRGVRYMYGVSGPESPVINELTDWISRSKCRNLAI
jgi:hypothetical protein